MMCDNGLCTSGQKWIKTRMKTPIRFNNKRNEVITWCLFNVWPCLFLNSHHFCMCYYHWCSLHHIYLNWVSNNNVHQGVEGVFDDKDIHSLFSVTKQKVGDLPLNTCSIFQNNSYNNILKCIMGYCMFIPTRALK
jgi:hypothetical protein